MDRFGLVSPEETQELTRPSPAGYDRDPHAWALEQAALLRKRRWSQLDIDHLADEIEDVARREARALESDFSVVLQQLLKWDRQPERQSRSWMLSIREHRRRVQRSLKENPSLSSKLAELTADAYADGRDAALRDTNLPEAALPTSCPYDWDEIMTRPIEWPETP